ncbi:unnamed protein product [Acanthoscelides obtectus]|uniref:Unc-13 n=1 Tax=Acanthoscelides obtectus TaxID=200917 RepID=A0A9P0L869_ACAOB|nr:unnamed protein product [Acanthoscelides obtectus]CAK1684279.1 hypothetical protein AOBTE_LOCUS34771 [Acanthoscelides obtectus]
MSGDKSRDAMAPAVAHQSANGEPNMAADYVISEYMERLGTRLNILETELKYAWRALDLLSQEYIKMWERLEKLEGLLYEQQSVISQLLDFYTTGGGTQHSAQATVAMLEGRLGELEVIREILGNGAVEDGLEEGLDVAQPDIQELDEMNMPDEAFYKSLNQAYREDLDPSCQASQLDMIWEEREEMEENSERKGECKDVEGEIYSALDYKDYRGNSPCVSEQDIAQLSKIDQIDQVTIEKLNELDRLSNKLHQDSVSIKQLQRKLLESPMSVNEDKKEETTEDNWTFTSDIRSKDDLLMLKSDLPCLLSKSASTAAASSYSTRPSSRLSVTDTDNEVAETLAGGIRTPTSPRRRHTIEVTTCNEPFTTVTGRLAYSAAVQHVESAEAAAAAALAAQNPKNPFYCGSDYMMAASYEAVPCSTPSIFSVRSEKAGSPTLSICSLRTRQDGYIDTQMPHETSASPSPPPPAPTNICNSFAMSNSTIVPSTTASNVFLGPDSMATACASSSIMPEHPPKSPKTSPRRSKSHSSNIVAAKSDSGLSSMSGWSSLEKSPGSPKNGTNKVALNYYGYSAARPVSPAVATSSSSRPFTESSVDTKIPEGSHLSSNFLPGGHHLSAFTTVKSPSGLKTLDGYGNFVPAPAPASDINVSPRKKNEADKQPQPPQQQQQQQQQQQDQQEYRECIYRDDQPAIYSVAGSNRETYTSVYTSNSADYINQSVHYPDLVEPYENNEFFNAQQRYYYNSFSSMPSSDFPVETIPPKRQASRSYSASKAEGVSKHEGYKTAMYRTMFPSGNITDALSYYPTSTRYEVGRGMPPVEYSDPNAWMAGQPDGQFPDSTSTSSSMRSAETSDTGYSPYMDRRQKSQHQQQPIYENQQQINHHNRQQWNQRQDIPYLELDLRNRNVPEYVVQQQNGQNTYYDASGVIMTQSGYITISSGNEHHTHPHPREEKPKKLKRGNTLKSAMSSVSHWLPDLHLTKRTRSFSLPGVSRKEDVRPPGAMRKKKKNGIVSTVSGIIQKAKRKGGHSQPYTQSLSDPEQSENEWTVNRTRSVVSEDDRSEDSSSVFSENQFERDIFPKITTTTTGVPMVKQKKASAPTAEQHRTEDEFPLQPVFESVTFEKTPTKPEIAENGYDEDHSARSNESNSSALFATIGDVKKSSSSEKSDETVITESKMVVVVGGASMEFAVSRALGKYRQRQSSSFSDDQIVSDEQGVQIEEIVDEPTVPSIEKVSPPKSDKSMSDRVSEKTISEQKSSDSQNSSENNKPIASDGTEGSPSFSLRSHAIRFLPKHQSLDIPGGRDDDDNRSTHSWRSTSRVSSRRQSTEDSIDSEDEWYCYELRKLEEMERHTHLEHEMGSTLHEEPEPTSDDGTGPDEEVKEKMSFVLRELRIKAKVTEGVLDKKDNDLHVVQSAKRRQSNRGSFQLDNAAALFAKITHYHRDEEEEEAAKAQPQLQIIEPEEAPAEDLAKVEEEDEEERSSGDTSGPDSPRHSTDEYDEVEMAINEELAKFHLSEDVQQAREAREARETRESASSIIPEIQIEPSSTPNREEAPASKEAGPMGSKWKLLKTLKEKKAEEKNNQGKTTVEPSEKDKVSMYGMVKSFYEVHVKT